MPVAQQPSGSHRAILSTPNFLHGSRRPLGLIHRALWLLKQSELVYEASDSLQHGLLPAAPTHCEPVPLDQVRVINEEAGLTGHSTVDA